MSKGNDDEFALDVDSLASVCTNKYVVFRQSRSDDIATAVLLVGNPTAITYTSSGETSDKRREEQWFAIHCITSTDDKKTAQQCWADKGAQADKVKRLRPKFENIKKVGRSDKGTGVQQENWPILHNTEELEDSANETMLKCLPSDTLLFKPVEDGNQKRLLTTIAFVNSTKLCFLPSKRFREQAKIDKPYLLVAHIDASDHSKSVEQTWAQYNQKPNGRCIMKKIPIQYDEAQLDDFLNEGEQIDKRHTLAQKDADEDAIENEDEHDENNVKNVGRSSEERTNEDGINEGDNQANDNIVEYNRDGNSVKKTNERDHGMEVSDGRA